MTEPKTRKPPLTGLTVIEMAGLGPAPHACLMLAEMGARVIRIGRPGSKRDFLGLPDHCNLDQHGRTLIEVDLASSVGKAFVVKLVGKADVLVEGFRPGVMEKLGIGPDTLCVENPRLLYARMTGFGQSGRLSRRAGHDLTYLAITGALHAMGHADRPPAPPLNLVADYGGGSMFLVNGILAALIERGVSGQGQVVDAAMIDGVSMLAAPFYAFMAAGHWSGERGANLLDSGAPFYDCYETSDDRFVAVACLEPAFFAIFADLLALSADLKRSQYARGKWPELRAAIAERLAQNTMTHWADLFSETDACVAPVLTFSEAASFPHNESRRSYHESDDWIRPMPAPRLSGSPMKVARPASSSMAFAEVLTDMGFDAGEIETLRQSGAFAEKP